MSLGVLNNLNAIYAENNLNNTSSSLSTVLQQLSSGSKINSGADDAAGLSLVDGLQANSMALMQSKTNATEGVGILTVADGALSQVTNLLNRAVTLATEASNGTLNSSQDTAANQEYQSILSEISNIGSTTTYNGRQVFNSQTNIFTGDSSTVGAAIDSLNIRSLSASNVGDTAGVMAYSNGTNNVFLNLSTGTANAQATDTLNGGSGGTTTINVNYLVKGANGAENNATTAISVGAGTSFANTANGLISAINGAGLGLTASFTTQAGAGVTGGGTETGIQISGGLVSAGVDPGTSSTGGVLNLSGTAASELLTQGQSLTLQSGTNAAVTVSITSAIDSLSTLATAINNADSNVTATVLTNGDGTQSLALQGAAGSGALTVTTSSVASAPISLAFTSGTTGATGGNATGTLGFGTSVASSGSEVVSGSVVLSNSGTPGANPVTFVMGGSAAVGNSAGTANGSTFTVNGNTLANLSTAIAAQLGATTSVGTSGITITSTSNGTTLEQVGASTLTATPSVAQTSNVAGVAATNGTDGTTTLALNGNGGSFVGADALNGTIVLKNGTNAAQTFTMGSAATAANAGGPSYTTGGETVNALIAEINSQPGTNISAALTNGNIVLSSSTPGTAINMVSSSLVQTSNVIAGTQQAYVASTPVVSTGASFSIGGVGATAAAASDGDTITGNIVIDPYAGNNGGTSAPVTFTMGGSGVASTTGTGSNNIVVAGNSLTNLLSAINNDSSFTGITAAAGTGAGTKGTISLTSSALGGSIAVTSSLTDKDTVASTAAGTTGTLALTSGGAATAGNALSGSVVLTDGVGTAVTFAMGGTTSGQTIGVAAQTLTGLAAAIQAAAGSLLTVGTTASVTNGKLVIANATGLNTIDSTGLSATVTNTAAASGTDGATAGSATQSSVSFSNATDGALDTMAGSIVLTNHNSGGSSTSYTFVMGSGTDAGALTGGTYYTGNHGGSNNITDLKAAIDAVAASADLDVQTSLTGGTLKVTSLNTGANSTNNLSLDANTLTDVANKYNVSNSGTNIATLSLQANNAASTPIAGSLVLTNSAAGGTVTFHVGAGNNTNTDYYTGNSASNETLSGLAAAINAANTANSSHFNFTASAASGSLAITGTGAGNVTVGGASSIINQSNSMTGVLSASYGNAAVASTGAGVQTSSVDINGSAITATGDTLSGSVVITSSAANGGTGVSDTFVLGQSSASSTYAAGGGTFAITGSSLNSLISAINAETNDASNGNEAKLSATAAINTNGSGFTLTDGTTGGSISVNSSALSDASTLSFTSPANGTNNIGQNLTGVIALTDTGKLTGTGTLSGSVTVTNNGVTDTFVLGQGSASSTYGAHGATYNITGSTISALTTAINAAGSDTSNAGVANLGLTASVDASTGGVYLESSISGATGLTASTSGLTMTLAETGTNGTNGAANATYTAAAVQFGNGGINSSSDPVSGSIVLTNVSNGGSTYGLGGGAVTFVVGAGTDTSSTYYTGASNETLGGLAATINAANTALGLSLSASASGTGGLTVTSNDTQSVITLGTSTLVDQYGAAQTAQTTGSTAQAATHANATVGTSGLIGSSDALSGSLVLNNGGTAQTFTMGSTYGVSGANITTGGNTLAALASAINSDSSLNINASISNGALDLQANATATSITVGSGTGDTLIDTVNAASVTTSTGGPGIKSTGSLNLAGGLTTAANTDTVSGSITLTGSGGTDTFVIGGTTSGSVIGVGSSAAGGETLGALATAINGAGIGISATVSSSGLSFTGTTNNNTAITAANNTLKDTTTTASLSYTAAAAYSVGISNSSLAGGHSLYDSSTGQTATGTNANVVANNASGSGVATISYSDGAGISLATTDLSNQTDAQSALTSLNQAITDVASMDGYIGAQINTLNAVSQVLSTQQENVVSAQNAVQATDYASATSNMSKYQILSQTGISALAQANSMQQEVTKLLQ